MANQLVTYAQNREDLVLSVLLSGVKKGFYVDVGANDPVIDSVTRLFYLKGWKGINIDPIPEIYLALARNRKRDINLNVAISDVPGMMRLRQYDGGRHGWSTLSTEVQEQRGSNHDHHDYNVPVRTLRDVFKEHKVTEIDFLKIDVEGLEYQVLAGNDWQHYRPKVIVVEDNPPKDWHKLLREVKYTPVHHDGINQYFVRDDLRDVCTMDNYIAVLFSGTSIITAKEASVEAQLASTQEWLLETQKDLSACRDDRQALQARLDRIVSDPDKEFGAKMLFQSFLKRSRSALLRRIKG